MRVASGDVCTVVSSWVISRELLVAGHWLVMGDATWLAVVLGGGPEHPIRMAPRMVGVLEPTRGKLKGEEALVCA